MPRTLSFVLIFAACVPSFVLAQSAVERSAQPAAAKPAPKSSATRWVDTSAPIPADAVVIFNGQNTQMLVDANGKACNWPVEDGELVCAPNRQQRQQGLWTRLHFRDAQIHAEFMVPVTGRRGGGAGNSGLYIHGLFEQQILDSYRNPTRAIETVGSIYGISAPLVNAARKPGVWQTYDIVYTAPRRDASGKPTQPGSITTLLNGVLVQLNAPFTKRKSTYTPLYFRTTDYSDKIRASLLDSGSGPLQLQDHDNPVRFRNIWIRPLDEHAFLFTPEQDPPRDKAAPKAANRRQLAVQLSRYQSRPVAAGSCPLGLMAYESRRNPRLMIAEVVAIGDELASGERLDTNSQWLSQRLGEIGIRVLYHTTVADDLEANVAVFRAAADRADVVVCTGGLGPTADDLTRDALAAAAGVELELDAPSLAHIQELFRRRGRDMPERNKIQAMFPQGSQPVHNPEGSAPGVYLELPRDGRPPCRVVALPGVPAEMQQMWEANVGDQLATLCGGAATIRHYRLKCFGLGESHLEQKLPDLIRRGREPSVGITVSGGTITLRVTARGGTADECQAAMQPTIETIHECLGELVFGSEDDELEHAVMRMLAERRSTLATIEWGTAGLVARRLAAMPEAATQFAGGEVVCRRSLVELGLLSGDDARDKSGDERLVKAMAVNAQARYHADLTLAVGPFPEPDPERQQPAQVTFALAAANDIFTKTVDFAGHSAILNTLYAKRAMNLVRLKLLGLI